MDNDTIINLVFHYKYNRAMDKRYKVTQEIVDSMRELRAQGLSYAKIGKRFNLSSSTSLYWCDSSQRQKQRNKNSKRRRVKGSKEYKDRIAQDLQKRKDNFKAVSYTHLRAHET